ncbi:MAG: biopolymer transporter ExbD [Candidatus Erginobacter occultus]|nr:biopolymer transporter ExbD [Candidatus Erginobacter occultus]
MKFKRKTSLEKGRLDIAPLVDVVLLLLIFFMLTSSFITPSGLRVDLPAASAIEPQERDHLTVAISEEGEFFIEDRPVSPEALRDRLAASLAAFPGRTLILEADRGSRHGTVVRVMSQARELGWEKMAIAAQPDQGMGNGE